jgi:4-amino-4-deoxy-L-arabinose transferase-like glycosyltransferase
METGTVASQASATDAPPGPGAARRRRVPRPLLGLLTATLLLGLAWSLVTPAWQAPDENSHYGYVQALVDGPGQIGTPGRPPLSTEQVLAAASSNSDQAAAQPWTKMEWSSKSYRRWRAAEATLPDAARGDGGGNNPARGNPPLYYLYEAVPYVAASHGDPFTRLLAARFGSVVWLVVTVLAVWLLAGEATGRNRLMQFAAASLAGLAPMMTFVSSSVTPDAMMYALWSLALWIGVRTLRRGLNWWHALSLLAIAVAACLVKNTSFALLPGLAFVIGASVVRARRPLPRRWRTAATATPLLGLVLVAVAWKVLADSGHLPAQLSSVSTTSDFNLRLLLSYLWQFYLPPLPMLSSFASLGHTLPAYDIWLKGSWGSFAWLEVQFPEVLYIALAVGTVGITGVAAVVTWRRRRTTDWLVVGFALIVTVSLLAGLHWTEYQTLLHGGPGLNQGRYLLPLVGVAGLVVARALQAVPALARAQAVGVVIGALLVLQFLSLGLMLERFYA